jgi:hypothetical protein
LNESGKWSPDAIERALAHKDGDNVRAAYHRGAHWNERVTMAQWWSDHLDVLRAGADVLSFKGRSRLRPGCDQLGRKGRLGWKAEVSGSSVLRPLRAHPRTFAEYVVSPESGHLHTVGSGQ